MTGRGGGQGSSDYRIEKLGREHLEGMISLLNDPVVAQWLGGGRSEEAVAELIDNDDRHWREHGFGTLVAAGDGEPGVLGRAGVRGTLVEGRDEVELFYSVRPEAWGRSIATELSRAALARFFEARPDGSVVAFTLPENAASIRVMEKLGFGFEGRIVHADLEHVLYRLAGARMT
jgi:RimJ/RimL family protein N-acetyltransferase